MKTPLKILLIYTAGFGTSLLLSKRMEEADFMRSVEGLIPQITSWWDNGEWFNITRKTLNLCDIVVDRWLGWLGVTLIIVLLGVVILNLKMNKPKK